MRAKVQLENIPRLKGKRLKQTVVGHEVHDADEYEAQIKVLPREFDNCLDGYDAGQLEHLFDLYKPWRDGCKVGFNRVDLEKLAAWLRERAR